MIKVLIIDDEQPAKDIVKAFLKPHGDMEVVGECANGFEGIKMIQELKPDLVFLDIQMPKLTGFEMLELIGEPPVIIFSTAYDQYAIKAFENNAVDYLLKPFSAKRFDEALEKAKNRLRSGDKPERDLVKNIREENEESLERIAIRNGSNIIILPSGDISHIEAQDDYVAIFSTGKKYLKQYTMKYLENALPKSLFLRVHRSYLVNITQIGRLEALTKDSYVAILKDGAQVPVSRSGYGALKDVLGI